MTNKNNDAYRNQPQFKTNQSLNKDITPDVPTFNSNALDNEGFMPLNSCSGGCGCKGHDEKAHKKDSNHKCCHDKYSDDHKHEECNCGHK